MSEVETPTAEEIAKHYSACLDSVTLINTIVEDSANTEVNVYYDMSAEDKVDTVERNVGHLKIMVEKDYWTSEDMTPINSAISAGETYIA